MTRAADVTRRGREHDGCGGDVMPTNTIAVHGSVWDLDHTLLSTDAFAEQLATTLLRRPWLLPSVVRWLLRGRGYCKGRIAALAGTPPEAWPVRAEALEHIAGERARGRSIVLATAAHRSVAEPLAEHLGCFDAVLASDDHENLKSQRKSAAIARLARVSGWSGYCYAGDCEADLAVWQHADEIVVVDPTPGLLARVGRFGKPISVLGTPRTGWSALVKACRPHQWAKNLLLLVPALLAHRVDPGTLGLVALAFVAFSACASGVYVLNDIGDVAADRLHPRKRLRPFASGRLTITAGLRLATLLFAVGLGLSAVLLPTGFLGLMVVYLCANLGYSSRLKQVPVLDVLMLACMYALRLEAGAVAAGVPLSDWFLTFSLFFFTSLAFAKRYTELSRLKAAGGEAAAGRGYEVGDVRLLEMLGTASGYVSVLVLALYMNSAQMRALYGESRVLWLICPLVLYWVTRLWLLANRGQLDEDPVVFALRDRASLAVGAACGLVALIATLLATAAP
jgi:4-hydroxybenzoate polyprenyltransferase/phosphoserine phosphatase